MYNLTTEVIGTGSLSPSSGSYTSGSSVTVIATAGRNQVFNSWTGDCSGTTPSCTLTMNGDRTARAIFMPSAYDLTVSATGEGIVAPASGTYTPGAVVQLAAQPSTGWQFSNWTGACSGTATTCSVTMSSDKSVNAVFTRITPASNTTLAKYALDVKVTGSGVVQVSPSQPVGGYSDGTVVQLTASPRTGWSLSAWGGACTGADLFCSITMNAAKSVTATFKATSLPDIVSAAWVQPQPNGTTLASWEAASGATQYVIELGGKKLQTVTGTTATLNRLIGPNDVVKIRSVNPAGTTEPSEPATFIASTVALQLFTVNFSAGSATLTAKAKTALNAAIRQIRASGYTSLSVVGHTDNTERNALALSVARARAVTAFVGNTLTLTFVTSGKGATSPLTSNSTAAGRAANRRAVGTVK